MNQYNTSKMKTVEHILKNMPSVVVIFFLHILIFKTLNKTILFRKIRFFKKKYIYIFDTICELIYYDD